MQCTTGRGPLLASSALTPVQPWAGVHRSEHHVYVNPQRKKRQKLTRKWKIFHFSLWRVNIFEGQQFTSMVICLSVIGGTLNSLSKRVPRWFTVKIPKLVFRRYWDEPESSVRDESPSVRTLYMCTLLLPNDCPLPVASVEIYFSVSWAGDLKWFGSKSEIIWQEWENLRQLRMGERGGRVALRKLHNSTTDRCPHSQLILTRINWFSTHLNSYQLILNSHLHSKRWNNLATLFSGF